MDFVLIATSVSLPMDLMNSERTIRKTAFIRPNSVWSSSEMDSAPSEIDATFCTRRKISILPKEPRK